MKSHTILLQLINVHIIVAILLVLSPTKFASCLSLSPNTNKKITAKNIPFLPTLRNPIALEEAVTNKCHLLILPGFGNASEDYTMERSIVPSLLNRGWDSSKISVLPVKRTDWFKVFLRGAVDIDFWRANAPPTKAPFRWYLDRISKEIRRIVDEEGEDAKIVLIGHSAGGWLARAALGFYCGHNTDEGYDVVNGKQNETNKIDLSRILGIVTLGAPNAPPPPTVMDMTRGALRITNENFPGSYHSPSMFYITVIGNAVQGKKQIRQSFLEPTSIDGFAFESYEIVCGDGEALGDGVVPLDAAHLDGATQLELDNVFHSINKPEQWYGSDAIIDQWLSVLYKELYGKLVSAPNSTNNFNIENITKKFSELFLSRNVEKVGIEPSVKIG